MTTMMGPLHSSEILPQMPDIRHGFLTVVPQVKLPAKPDRCLN